MCSNSGLVMWVFGMRSKGRKFGNYLINSRCFGESMTFSNYFTLDLCFNRVVFRGVNDSTPVLTQVAISFNRVVFRGVIDSTTDFSGFR